MSDQTDQRGAIRVLIVDDHPVVRDGLRGMFAATPGIDVIGEAGNGDEAVAKAAALGPDVVLMDLRMPESDGVSAIREMRRLGLDARVLVLTTYDTDNDVLPAVEAGATGYMLKDAPSDELIRAVQAAARGEAVMSPPVVSRLMGNVRRPRSAASTLSEREQEVLELVAQGATNKAVAEALYISEATVKTHLLHLYAKLGVNDRAAAVAAGYERRLLTPSSGD